MHSNVLTLPVSDKAFALIIEMPGLILFERGNLPQFIIVNTYADSLDMKMDVGHYLELEKVIARECTYNGSISILDHSHIHVLLDSSL